MSIENHRKLELSRRSFLKQIRWAPVLFLSAPFAGSLVRPGWRRAAFAQPLLPHGDAQLTPHYPAKSPLQDIFRLAAPGSDEYVVEGYAHELMALLGEWSQRLKAEPPATATLGSFVASSIQSSSLAAVRETLLRPRDGIEVLRREFATDISSGREQFLTKMDSYLAPLQRIETADFEIYACEQLAESPLATGARIRYEFVGVTPDKKREQRIGTWNTQWTRDQAGQWEATKWSASAETLSRAAGAIFIDVTSQALGHTSSYKDQLRHGADYWRTTLDGAIGVDVYGNNGVSVGDFDGDGRDDLYVCQPAGLPNRLYRNRGDGTFEDVTEKAGVGVLDFTACALFADFDNRGVQDLLVVCATGPLFFANNGNGTFSLKRDAFRFAQPPEGAFTHAAAADYDGDGRLDIYFCLYSYYQGLDQYHYPVPYFDARNGPPNYLFHNEGNGVFQDRTNQAGLNIDNDRYSFACSWSDNGGNGRPDLYVVNDFGRNNFYRNNGDGSFTSAAGEARVDEAGAGMSACWLDFDNDGRQDIYGAGMWVAAGMRVFQDPHFHHGEPEKTRSLYHRHMLGNSLYRNEGSGAFENVGGKAGVENGRWSWSSGAWDFDHDGYPDLYVANGYISGPGQPDVSSFFWRQVVAKSPPDSTPSPAYERGWNAINEMIRSDASWNGFERNNFFVNNRDGTFTDVSGVVGLDFREDSRAFALADLDGDGRLEIVVKNRNAPQVRVVRLAMEGIGDSLAFRLRGHKSNRDAIGAAVTVETGPLRQTKYIEVGSGFLSQHTKELFFGLGKPSGPVRATIRWPGGLVQAFNALPINRRIEIEEGAPDFKATPFSETPQSWKQAGQTTEADVLPSSFGTWLVEPVQAPAFSLPDVEGNLRDIDSFRGAFFLINFWTTSSASCLDQLRRLKNLNSESHGIKLRVAAINTDDPVDIRAVKSLIGNEGFKFPILFATPEVSGVYNILYRYSFDRHRDLPLPTSFLIDEKGDIVRLYQGIFTIDDLIRDVAKAPNTAEDRRQKALPFPGKLYQEASQRKAFTYGVAFLRHGFLDRAADSFRQVIAQDPNDEEALYNLGTIYLQQNSPEKAREVLEQAVKLRPDYPEAWNNLGMLAARQGNNADAIQNFKRSLELRPTYATALLNLGNVYRRAGNAEEAETLLKKAVASEPENPEANYALGVLYARQNRTDSAEHYLERAVALRPDYSDALNNLGVLFVQEQRFSDAEEKFKSCIQAAPDFDQPYLNLARLYVVMNDKTKARAVLQALLEKQPEHNVARQMMQMLY